MRKKRQFVFKVKELFKAHVVVCLNQISNDIRIVEIHEEVGEQLATIEIPCTNKEYMLLKALLGDYIQNRGIL